MPGTTLATTSPVLPSLSTIRCWIAGARPSIAPGIAALEASDLEAINRWLCVTRWRTVATVLAALPVIAVVGGVSIAWVPIVSVCGAAVALCPIYGRAMARGYDLRTLVYVQLIVDTLAIAVGLAVLGHEGGLFRYFFLMTIVPATMVSGTCGVTITVLSTLCYAGLLPMTGSDAARVSGDAGLPAVTVFIFGVVATQCFYYRRNLRDKNRHLAASTERLDQANAAAATTAETALGLVQVGRALSTSLDLGLVIERLHDVAIERLRTDWCATILVDPGSPSGYRIMASRGLGPGTALGNGFWEFGALVAAEGVAEFSDRGPNSAPTVLANWGVASGLFAAMRCRNRTLGLFATGYRAQRGAFTPMQRELATGIATQAAVAIENATLHARQREEAEISAALLQISELLNGSLDAGDRLDRLAALVCSLMQCDFADIMFCDPLAERFRIVAGRDAEHPQLLEESRHIDFDIGKFPVLARACREGWAEVSESGGLEPMEASLMRRWSLRSVGIVPLNLRGEIIGALVAGSHRRGRPLGDKGRSLLTGIAHQTVIALENSRLIRTLRAANSLKSEFISTISHELRTPLNAIIGYNELLADGEFGPVNASQQEVCGKVLSASRQLLELIQATLDISRMDAGALPVNLVPVNVRLLLDEVGAQVPAALIKPGVRLTFHADPEVGEVESDHPKLKMAVRNLVHNALKFTERGAVTVRAFTEDEGATLVIMVTDTGIGISDEGRAIIFEMFRQVDGSDRRRHDGVGLGLYIVQRLMTLLGGMIDVESELGRGSCFRIRLPMQARTRCLPQEEASALSA